MYSLISFTIIVYCYLNKLDCSSVFFDEDETGKGTENAINVPDVTKHPNWYLLEHENCGITNSDRIIGGKNASLGQYPWLVRIGYSPIGKENEVTPSFKCGGTLISKLYVITAAHCVTSLPNIIVSTIRMGENNVLTQWDCDGDVCAEPVQDVKPESIIVHRDYGKPAYKNDIALIRLSQPAYFNGWVQPACIPYGVQLVHDYVGSSAEVAGWGVFDMDFPVPSTNLLHVSLPVVNLNKCIEAFKRHAKIGSTQLCVGGVEGEDSCGGDSGGPLVHVESVHGSPHYYILGIVSFGAKRCGSSLMPAIYTRMSSYVVWLLDNMLP